MSLSPTSRRTSILIAATTAIALAAWIASGLGRGPEPPERAGARDRAPMQVSVDTSRAQTRTREILVSARTEPDRGIELKAETEGRVVAIGAERGALVEAGDPIVELDLRDREARLAEAEALVRQRELEFAASERLLGQSFISAAELAAAEALLVAARAQRERIALDIAHTSITAPFDALVYDRVVEIGDYVAVGDPIAELVDVDPLIVVGNVNEHEVGALSVGGKGSARVLGGSPMSGIVRYIAPAADESTRTFRVELAIPNTALSLRAGTSAELVLGADEIRAHSIAPTLLALADDGTVGVKTVDASNRVEFMPVEIAGSTPDGVLVTGLPPVVRVITVGQGFVADGQTVIPVEEDAGATTEATDSGRARNERTY